MIETSVEKKNTVKYGYQAPRGRRTNYGFMCIDVENMHYCWSHDFWFSQEEQNALLHQGKPCIYTDYGYAEGNHNSFGRGCMLWKRGNGFTLRKAIRLLKRTRNLPIGTIVKIGHNWRYASKKGKSGIELSYDFKVRKENKFDPKYEISPEFSGGNFNTDEKAKALTDLLRANGFIVAVRSKNPNFISSLVATAAAHIGKSTDVTDEEGEIATAYGHGLRVGFSSGNSTYRGYSCGVKSILFDKWNEFDKWSRCREISKEKTNEEILNILLNVKNEPDDNY